MRTSKAKPYDWMWIGNKDSRTGKTYTFNGGKETTRKA